MRTWTVVGHEFNPTRAAETSAAELPDDAQFAGSHVTPNGTVQMLFLVRGMTPDEQELVDEYKAQEAAIRAANRAILEEFAAEEPVEQSVLEAVKEAAGER